MNNVGNRDLPKDYFDKEIRESLKKEEFNLSEKLIEGAVEIVEQVINTETDRDGLKSLLLLRHVTTGLEPQFSELRQFLFDLPSYILTVHSQMLQAKREKERLLSILRPKAERLIIEEKMRMKEGGIPLSLSGSVTKDDIRDKLHTMSEFSELAKWENEEDTLGKIVSLLENRRYELSKILEIEMKGSV